MSTKRHRNVNPNKKTRARKHSTHTHITDYEQVHNRSSLIRYIKHLYVSKLKDDKDDKNDTDDKKVSTVHRDDRWEHHTISDFLDAMLSGAGYEPLEVTNGEPIRDGPKNPYTFFAYLLTMGKIYE